MKSVLIVLSQKDQSHLQVNESLAALMLFASFNLNIHVLFKDAALSLLAAPKQPDIDLKQFLKPAFNMVESFEFYDIEHLYILQQDQHLPYIQNSPFALTAIHWCNDFIRQFDHIIWW